MFHLFPDGAVDSAKLVRRLLLEYGPQSDAQPYSQIRAALDGIEGVRRLHFRLGERTLGIDASTLYRKRKQYNL